MSNNETSDYVSKLSYMCYCPKFTEQVQCNRSIEQISWFLRRDNIPYRDNYCVNQYRIYGNGVFEIPEENSPEPIIFKGITNTKTNINFRRRTSLPMLQSYLV